METKKTILVAPLHWGLGHAARCIPIIDALLAHNFNVLLASDGGALQLLQKEFPHLPAIELPSYNITYPKKGAHFKMKMLLKLPSMQKAILKEKAICKELVASGKIQGIISDNRMGIRHKKIPSVFMTHQLYVPTGNTSYFSSKMHQKIIAKYNACWVPDYKDEISLSGKLGHPKKVSFPLHYLGPLSRMQRKELPKKYDILILLSGPEPQRTFLEEKLISQFKGSNYKTLLIQGVVSEKEKRSIEGTIKIVNFLTTKDLEIAINESELVIARSGYTTIMDLAALKKNAFFIPTPGQFEQEYLAKRLKKLKFIPSCKQEKFNLTKLNDIKSFKGFKDILSPNTNYKKLFALFEGE